MRCLLCNSKMKQQPSFSNLFPQKHNDFCAFCWQLFERIDTQGDGRCQTCVGLVDRYTKQRSCEQCCFWNEMYDYIPNHRALFCYNETAKEVLHQIKFLGDCALIDPFVMKTNEYLRNYMNKGIITAIPSHSERLKKRKIDVLKHFCTQLDYPFEFFLVKLLHTPHQSEQTKQARLQLDYPFEIQNNPKHDLIVIDDVYTTGATMYQAVAALQQAPNYDKEIQTFSLFR